ncbi:uncharacterized protein N7459_006259 [Penicillium hispanicum]|uniref:uncharacterized protein n=1 Tax=Penicillium hispanicum TaxID=1080232 RepID=UPI00254200A0|nr:uncharacterized protein N7459_006259 [Penicillium hispanicum]KAJ5580274.1 hypothetical protein N7459_006259 [Penicillium hispanicum]
MFSFWKPSQFVSVFDTVAALTCRLRHLKCDKTGTKCLRCQRSGRECVPAPGKSEEVSFRHGQNPSLRGKGPPRYGESDLAFPNDQTWVPTSSDYSFKDETDQTASEYYVVPLTATDSLSRSSSEARSTPSSSMDPSVPVPDTSGSVPLYIAESQGGSQSTSTNSPSSSTTPISLPRLANVNEAYLLRHFQRHLAPWLDAGDPEWHFSADVARRASQSPLLLYACLAVSACHLSRTTNTIPPNVADSYHERCVSIMLPVLEKPEFEIAIDILLSSTVILRFFEQISSHTPSNDPQRHLLAGSVYISSHVGSAISGGLASASFWVFVIQDIQFALTYQKCLRLTFAPFDDRLRHLWAAKPILSDGDWVNRAIWLLAETIDFCYNVSGRNYGGHLGIAGEIALKQRIREWETSRADSFIPLHVSPPEPEMGKPFPVVWYTSLWHCESPHLYKCAAYVWTFMAKFRIWAATAMQHVCLAKALMLIRETELYDVSSVHRANLKEQISENLNYLFGIALSADDEPSLRIMACHALCACSSWIDDLVAQNLLFDLLRRTERENGWPWAYVEQRILHTWQGRSQ